MNKFKYILALFSVLCLFSCEDFLDKEPDDTVTEEQVFTRYDKVDGMVTRLYDYAKGSNKPLIYFNHFTLATITDECSAVGNDVESGIPFKFHDLTYGPHGMPANSSAGQYWWDLYPRIRHANLILYGIEKWNTPQNPVSEPTAATDLQTRIGETYFLRAYLHWLVIRSYGEAVYMDYAITDPAKFDMKTFQKESYHSMVQKIVSDCETAMTYLPDKHLGKHFGRADKGACLGLIAMARWFAATPMWNGGTFPNDTREFKEEYTYKAERWEAARDAAKKVLDYKYTVDGAEVPRYEMFNLYTKTNFEGLTGSGNPSGGKVYRRLWEMNFHGDAINKEWIWFVTNDKNEPWCRDNFPPSFGHGGQARQRPVQEQVDEYEIIIDGYGYPIWSEKAKGVYTDNNPYENRDPRLYRDVVYHGSTFGGKVMNLTLTADRVLPTTTKDGTASHTGYYQRKFIPEGYTGTERNFHISGPAIIRLPHMIYIYCEAVNELQGPTEEIYNMINDVRERSFMAPMPPEVLDSKELMRDYIYRERRVEFFFENLRYFTSRLYLEPTSATEQAQLEKYKALDETTAAQTILPYPRTQQMAHGMYPVADPEGEIVIGRNTYKMVRIKKEDRVFSVPKSYLWPLMNDEVQRAPNLKQNPGW